MPLLAPRYTGIEIPVFSPDTRVCHRYELGELGSSEDERVRDGSFVRAVLFEPPPTMIEHSLADVLGRTDEELERVARLCGAVTLKPKWGLFQTDNLSQFHGGYHQSPQPQLPNGYILLAQVDLVPDAREINNKKTLRKISKGIDNYYTRSAKDWLRDIKPEQFVKSKTKDAPPTLVDIEPYWG